MKSGKILKYNYYLKYFIQHIIYRLSAYNNHQPSFGPFKAYTHYDTMGKVRVTYLF